MFLLEMVWVFLGLVALYLYLPGYIDRRIANFDIGPPPRIGDIVAAPYSLAFLSGGPSHTLQVAALNLSERVAVDIVPSRNGADFHVVSTGIVPVDSVTDPLDAAIVGAAAAAPSEAELAAHPKVRAALDDIERRLAADGLLLSAATVAKGRSLWNFSLCIVVLPLLLFTFGGFGAPIPSGGALWLCWGFGLQSLWRIYGILGRKRTGNGDRAIEFARTLCGSLPDAAANAVPRTRPADVTLAVAVFGFGVLPGEMFPIAKIVVGRLPKRRDAHAGGVTIEWGSSCGFSGDGGGSCGGGDGGGCGGGCGG